MTTITSPAQRHFVVSVDVSDGGASTDLIHMQDGLQRAAEIARREGMLTSHDDEDTIVTGIGVSSCPEIADVVMAFYGTRIEKSDEARKAIAEALGVVASNFSSDRLQILSKGDRELLVAGIGQVRAGWERNQEGWVAEQVRSGYHGWIQQTDADIIREAILVNYCLDEMETAQQVDVLRLLARDEAAMRFIQEVSTDEDLDKLRMKLRETLDCMAQATEWDEASRLVEQLLDEIGGTLQSRLDVDDVESDSPGM